jgi:hypothetical protein
VDMYIAFEGNGEPGQSNFDYKSTRYGDAVESIDVRPGMPHFCTSCAVYVAVYGKRGGEYSLSATSHGLAMLQVHK